MSEKNKQKKVKVPISFKLETIFSILLIVALGAAILMVAIFVRNDEQQKAIDNNLTINERTAKSINTAIQAEQINAVDLLNALHVLSDDDTEAADFLFKDYCNHSSHILFIKSQKTGVKCNEKLLTTYPDFSETVERWLDSSEVKKVEANVLNDSSEVLNASGIIHAPALCILFPFTVNGKKEMAAVAYKSDSLTELLTIGSNNSTFLVNREGEVLIHTDYDKMVKGENLSYLPAVKEFASTKSSDMQKLLPDENGENWYYANQRIIGDMLVITSVSENQIFQAIDRTTRLSILFACAVIFLAVFVIRLFSKGITSPIGDLVDAAHSIEEGNYELDLKPRTKDEVGLLTNSFTSMAKGLAERERLKTTFSKFTNKAIAEKAMRGEMQLGGETKNATIFFSDIRSFTAMSEKLTPEEVVDFLNKYMTRMVECVNKTNGVVDKYIGDAIMAVWGAPESAGTPADDAWNAVKAALMMRISLYQHNKERAAEGKPPIKIGCGLNTGPVVAGQIGSSERMEYTVIGDAVNFASRTESLNKPFATDILITENTWNYVKDKIIYEEMPSVHVKGKEAAVRMFAVVNVINAKSGPQNINELRQFLGNATPDLGKVNTDEEEKKYKING